MSDSVLKKLALFLNGKEDEINLCYLFGAIREKNDKVMGMLYQSVFLRPLCIRHAYGDEFQLELINHGSPMIDLHGFHQIWSRNRPQETMRVSSEDRLGLRDIFNAIAAYENSPTEGKDGDQVVEREEGKDGQGGDAHLIFAGSISKAYQDRVEIRALCSTLNWLDGLIVCDTFKRYAQIVPDELDFEMFIELLESVLCVERFLKSHKCTLNSLLLEAVLSQPDNPIIEWPIAPYYRVTHMQVLELARIWDVSPKEEPYLLWIIKQALETGLPAEWELVEDRDEADEDGEEKKQADPNRSTNIYFQNTMTGETSPEHPGTNYFKQCLAHERQQMEQLREFGAMNSDYDPIRAFMRFTFPVIFKDNGQFRQGSVAYFYNFATEKLQGVPPEPEDGFLLNDENGILSSMVTQSFPIRQNIDAGAFDAFDEKSSKKKVNRFLQRKEAKRFNPNDVETLSFRSWWNDATLSEGPTKRFVDVFYHIATGNVQVIIHGSERVFTFSHLMGKTKPLDCFDFYVGAMVNILGRKTTLMQASTETVEWIIYHERRLRDVWTKLQNELLKYDKNAAVFKTRVRSIKESPSGKANLRAYLEDIADLQKKFAQYRPKLAIRIVGDALSAYL